LAPSLSRTFVAKKPPAPFPASREASESQEYRFSISEDNFGEYGKQVLQELKEKVTSVSGWIVVSPNYEGLRVRCTLPEERGWFLLRMSLHDPVMPLNIESDVDGGINSISDKLNNILNEFTGLKRP